jgi:predicted Rossmann-fold nucleotide-binding protein
MVRLCEILDSGREIDRFPLVDWIKGKVLAEGKVFADELDLITVTDDPAEVVRIIKKAHIESGFNDDATTEVTGGT